MAAGVGVFGHRALGQQSAQHLVRGPANGAHRGDTEALVDLSPAGVVDACHHVLDAVRLTGDAGSEDVGVVPVADGSERVGVLDAGLAEGVPVEPDAGNPLALEAAPQSAEGSAVGVDDGHIMALALETEGQGRPDPAATHDDEVHAATLTPRTAPPSEGMPGGRRATPGGCACGCSAGPPRVLAVSTSARVIKRLL